jgi:hypothetical protein
MSLHKSPFLYFQMYTTAITVISPKQIPCEDITGTRIILLQNMTPLLTSILVRFGRAARTSLSRLIKTQNKGAAQCPPPPAPRPSQLRCSSFQKIYDQFRRNSTKVLRILLVKQYRDRQTDRVEKPTLVFIFGDYTVNYI